MAINNENTSSKHHCAHCDDTLETSLKDLQEVKGVEQASHPTPKEEGENTFSLKENFFPVSILLAAVILGGSWIYAAKLKSGVAPVDLPSSSKDASSNISSSADPAQTGVDVDISALEAKVLPQGGVELPVQWKDFGSRMVEAGVIDKDKFEALYSSRGGMTEETKALLYGKDNGKLRITLENSSALLNLLWAFGLSNKNVILDTGPMQNPQYGGADGFASTGGWTLAKGDAMDHYSKHAFVSLTADQQALVERVSQGIYRPCCNNPTYFPDCNHGMAMLGLLELMAASGVGESEMYNMALKVNAYWFPDTYLTIAKYFESKGLSYEEADPEEILGQNFSSASGYRQILEQVTPPERKSGGGGCGV